MQFFVPLLALYPVSYMLFAKTGYKKQEYGNFNNLQIGEVLGMCLLVLTTLLCRLCLSIQKTEKRCPIE